MLSDARPGRHPGTVVMPPDAHGGDSSQPPPPQGPHTVIMATARRDGATRGLNPWRPTRPNRTWIVTYGRRTRLFHSPRFSRALAVRTGARASPRRVPQSRGFTSPPRDGRRIAGPGSPRRRERGSVVRLVAGEPDSGRDGRHVGNGGHRERVRRCKFPGHLNEVVELSWRLIWEDEARGARRGHECRVHEGLRGRVLETWTVRWGSRCATGRTATVELGACVPLRHEDQGAQSMSNQPPRPFGLT
jgi:hypothetical protein